MKSIFFLLFSISHFFKLDAHRILIDEVHQLDDNYDFHSSKFSRIPPNNEYNIQNVRNIGESSDLEGHS